MTEQHDPFRFAPPPRYLPLSMRLVSLFNVGTQVALVWLLFSTPFFWLFAAQADISWITFMGAEEVNGRITNIEETSASENDASIYAVHYSYYVEGERFEGTSYATGYSPTAGDEVLVLYKSGDPARSKVDGMRRSMFGPFAMIVFIFPLVGLIGLWFTLKWGMKRNRLLAHGLVADGTLESNEPTNTTVNDEPVMALTFGFTAKDGRKYSAEIRTTETKWLTDEEIEQILYDPAAPDTALGLDQLDPFPDFDESGRMVGSLKRAAIRSILPALTLLANWYFLKRFLD